MRRKRIEIDGYVAHYDAQEELIMRGLIAHGEGVAEELRLLHRAKAVFAAHISNAEADEVSSPRAVELESAERYE